MNTTTLRRAARRHRVAIALVVLAALAAVALRRPLVAWFTGQPMTSGSRSAPVRAQAGALTVEAAIEPEAPRQEGNVLHLRLTGAGGAPLAGAGVKVEYVMPPMGGMAEMRGAADVADEGDGRYRARFDLPMAGSWTLEVTVSGAATGAARFSLTVGAPGLRSLGGEGAGQPAAAAAPPILPPLALPDPALAALGNALTAYEEVRAALAVDRLEPVAPAARVAAEQIRAAARSLAAGPAPVVDCVNQAAARADQLAAARSLEAARQHFGELSRFLVALASADPRLQPGWHLFRCPMARAFNVWLQRPAAIENPYMGQSMATCGSELAWHQEQAAAPAAGAGPISHEGHGHQGEDVAFYTCAMHPSVENKEPGQCPICAMELSAVTYEETESGIVRVAAERRQRIGLKTAVVTRAPMRVTIRAVGRLTYDETRLKDVTLKVKGWVARLKVAATGQPVKKGETLLTLYSPELYAAQQEYLLALDSQTQGPAGRGDYLVKAAEKKLSLWDLTPGQIASIAKRRHPIEELAIAAPASGFVIEKDVVEGAAVEPGQRLFRIAALDKVWIEAQVYEMDLARVKKGQPAAVSLPYQAGERIAGVVAYVYPYLDPATRTGRIRIELPNKDLAFKPDMYANVEIAVDLGPRLQVPLDAVVYTGPRRLVFVDLGDDRIRPQEVTLGARNADHVEITSGLSEGQVVVTAANFLVAAESRIRSAAQLWSDERTTAPAPAPTPSPAQPPPAGGGHAGH
jgi:Cu(I)/Ag(I) efflux system membrane fusion protein